MDYKIQMFDNFWRLLTGQRSRSLRMRVDRNLYYIEALMTEAWVIVGSGGLLVH